MQKANLCLAFTAFFISSSLQAQYICPEQMEYLDRGLTVVPAKNKGMFVSWRMLGTDDEDRTTFDILRNGAAIAKNVYLTNYTDANGSATAEYRIVTKIDGEPVDTTNAVQPWAQTSLTIPIDRPATGTGGCTYTPNDCSVGDVDGDGQYELFLKWDPSNSKDNSQSGTTGNVFIDCYRLDGTRLWRIDLGPNIRAGAHYTQFMVYDFDGDGRAEMMVKTAPGSIDGTGRFVNQAATDSVIRSHANNKTYRNSSGHILQGAEYLTLFEGMTGCALHTTWYLPGRAGTGGSNENGSELGKVSTFPNGFWGDNYGNRSERYLAAVASIDGADSPACAIFCRGYYTQAYVWAVSFDGTRLHTRWLHASPSKMQSVVFGPYDPSLTFQPIVVDGDSLQRKGLKSAPKNTSGITEAQTIDGSVASRTLYSNGNHNLSVADVDGDGCDEIIWGSAALDHDGTLLYATGLGHGDAIHVGDLLPDRPGLEVYQIHEERLQGGFGAWDLHDAATGEIIYIGGSDGVDNGRGMAADISKDYRGQEFWSYDDNNPRRADNGKYAGLGAQSCNFRIYWNGDLQDELLDGHYASHTEGDEKIFDYVDHVYITEGNARRIVDLTNRSLCNTTKMTPCLSADLLGDWREEMVLWDYNNPTALYIHTTDIETKYRVPTLMHDHTYRMGVCWQSTAYNQPPHLGYYLPDAMLPSIVGSHEVTVTMGEAFEIELPTHMARSGLLSGRLKPGGGLTTDITCIFSSTTHSITLSGTTTLPGDYEIRFRLTNSASESVVDTIIVHSVESSDIHDILTTRDSHSLQLFDTAGRRIDATRPGRGIHIVREQTPQGSIVRKVVVQ